jgi:hypothetical protein
LILCFLAADARVRNFKTESLVHDQKSRGASKDEHRGKEETIVVDLKVGRSAKK